MAQCRKACIRGEGNVPQKTRSDEGKAEEEEEQHLLGQKEENRLVSRLNWSNANHKKSTNQLNEKPIQNRNAKNQWTTENHRHDQRTGKQATNRWPERPESDGKQRVTWSADKSSKATGGRRKLISWLVDWSNHLTNQSNRSKTDGNHTIRAKKATSRSWNRHQQTRTNQRRGPEGEN